jgi:hypothetical protein
VRGEVLVFVHSLGIGWSRGPKSRATLPAFTPTLQAAIGNPASSPVTGQIAQLKAAGLAAAGWRKCHLVLANVPAAASSHTVYDFNALQHRL